MKSLKDFFPECLEKSAETYPVVLVLDSLDQLSIDDGGRQMDWFPRNLPSNVYAVLSTLPGQEYQVLPSLRVSFLVESRWKLGYSVFHALKPTSCSCINSHVLALCCIHTLGDKPD